VKFGGRARHSGIDRQGIRGLKRLDIKEVNPYLRASFALFAASGVSLSRQPAEIPGAGSGMDALPRLHVLAAIAERANRHDPCHFEGKSLTEVRLTIKNQAQPFLKSRTFPPERTILTAEVAGEKSKTSCRALTAIVYLAPDGFQACRRVHGFFRVSPFRRALRRKKAIPTFPCRKMDVPINVLEWELFLPDRFKVRAFSGDAIPHRCSLRSTSFILAIAQAGMLQDLGMELALAPPVEMPINDAASCHSHTRPRRRTRP